MRSLMTIVVAVAAGLVLGTGLVAASDTKGPAVRLVPTPLGFELQRNGKPYFIKGAGGETNLAGLAAAGANSVRTWSPDNIGPLLDEAQKLGLSVTVGIWLGQPRQGFDYANVEQVAKQAEMVRRTILKFKDHPAVLIWGLGNEMEGDGENAAVWNAIESLAVMAHKIDPNHPTMTVIAEMGGHKVKNLHRLCPDIDIVGINSYAGAASVPKRYKEAGGSKPYMLTEFGPPGQWETAKTAWGAAPELTSTQKAAVYRRTYEQAVLAPKGLCLGSYAFLWGHKQETTATWFGLLLPNGKRTGAVDVLTELWTGKPPANRCPEITSLTIGGPTEVEPGATIPAKLAASDPDGDPIQVRWELVPEASAYGAGGDAEPETPAIRESIIKADAKQAEVKMPRNGGGYRLYAYVFDNHDGAAVANVPLFVKGPVTVAPAKKAKIPFIVYDEADHDAPYAPSGWMGNTKAIQLDRECPDHPHSGKTCIRAAYVEPRDWGGVVWQHPANNWGDLPGGFDLTGAKKLTFWARGEKGGEVVSFEFGIVKRDKKYFDSASGRLGDVKLTTEWKQYTIDLSGKDLTRIATAFVWVVAADGKPVTFYLDDIRYED